MSGLPETPPTLTTERLTLRPLVPEDAPRVQELAGHEAVARGTLTIPHPYEDGMAEEWIAARPAAWKRGELLVLGQVTDADGLIGVAGIELDLDQGRGELGYWIGVPYWGRGYATEAGIALVDYGFREIGLRRIFAQHYASNPASGRVLEKVGMKREGVLREHIVRFGSVQDAVVYGALATEWLVESR